MLKTKIKKNIFRNSKIFFALILISSLIFPSLIWPSRVYAFNTGTISPGTVANDATVGNIMWSYPSGAMASDGFYADSSSFSDDTTNYLKATNFDFSIPSEATIDGILVEIERHYETLSSGTVKDSEVKIVKSNGTIGTTNKADTINDWPASDAYASYGSSSDDWGENWSSADINDADFGVVLSANLANDYPLAYVNHIRITVYYSMGLSCSITTSASCSETVLLRMSGSDNAHAELPSQTTPNYDNNVVCCKGITGLGSSCAASNKAIIVRLSGTTGTNSHVEENTETNPNYNTINACISSKAGDIITVGYQPTNCVGYDTTLFSMSNTPTNSTIGIPSAYTNKVCATVFSVFLTFSINSNTIPLGSITPSTTGIGSHTAQVGTNGSGGFVLTYNGPTLTASSGTIPAYGAQQSSVIGTAGFGINLKDNTTPNIGAELIQNFGTCASPAVDYGTVDKYSYVANTTTALTNQTTPAYCKYTISYVANASSVTPAGDYFAPITYIVTGTF